MNKRKGSSNNFYRHFDKRRKKQVLEVGMCGFLFTCNTKVKYCIREAYNILDDYSNKLFGPEEESVDVRNEDGEEKEIEDELEKEVESLKKTNQRNVDGCERRFQVVESGVNNCVFIKSTVSDPVELVSTMMKDIFKTHQQISRYIMRFLPVEVTCKAYVDDIKKVCEKLFEKHFMCQPTTYSIVYNKRYNSSLLRDEVIESVARLVQDRNILHKVDLKHAEKAIVIDVIKSVCCISVVPDYFKLKKYNLLELSKQCDGVSVTEVKTENEIDKNVDTDTEKVEIKSDCGQ